MKSAASHTLSPLGFSIDCSVPAGEYRNVQQRLANNAESVAFYGGIDREGSVIRSRFAQLVKHQAQLLRTQWRFSMWQVGLREHTTPSLRSAA